MAVQAPGCCAVPNFDISCEITGFWAKLDRDADGRIRAWHSVAAHSADVAACFSALLAQPVLRRRVARLAGLNELTDIQAARLCVLAALHDLGKFNHGFQDRALPRATATCGHVREAVALIDSADAARLANALGFDEMLGWAVDEETMVRLLVAALDHHGRPIPCGQHHVPSRWRASAARDPFAGVADLAACTRRWFPLAFTPDGPPLPARPELQHAFNGVLTLADWIGSDPHAFPPIGDDDVARFEWAKVRARSLMSELGLDASPARDALGSGRPAFAHVSPHTPTDIQAAIATLPADGRDSITVLEAETGSGKTEAALTRFLSLFHAGAVDGLYFALPTRTAATQIYERVRRAVERAFPTGSRPAVTLAVPGYLAVDDRIGHRLPGFEVLWNDDDRERWRFRGWAAERPKRYLAGTIVVGTIDQVLLSTLMTPHAHLRAAALLRHLLVVDEVHASDAYMTRILEDVLDRHVRAGGHALLMSATLGAAARERLLAPGTRPGIPPLDSACAVPYPLVTHVERGAPPVHTTGGSGRRRDIAVQLAPSSDDADQVATIALGAARRGARVLVIRNTVRDCLATQQALERMTVAQDEDALLFRCSGVAAPHHARFAREDRTALDRALEDRFGRDAWARGCVAVATQTVQQSLDIDADYLLTDLCPVDVLLQRLGRLHRHVRPARSAGYQEPAAIVLVPDARDLSRYIRKGGEAAGPHGLGRVYENLTVIEATWRLLERFPVLVIPEMSRLLVEHAVHPEALRAIEEELGDAWIAHGRTTRAIYLAHGRLAHLNMVDWSTGFGELVFPEGELSRVIQTRLGQDDRLACFAVAQPGPFGHPVAELILPAHLVVGAPADAAPTDVQAVPSGFAFTFGARRYTYDRLGLRRHDTTQSDPEVPDA